MVWALESITYNLPILQSPDFKELTRTTYLLAALGAVGSTWDLGSIVPLAVNWIVVEVVTSSWGLLWVVFAAGAGIAWKIYEHFEVH